MTPMGGGGELEALEVPGDRGSSASGHSAAMKGEDR